LLKYRQFQNSTRYNSQESGLIFVEWVDYNLNDGYLVRFFVFEKYHCANIVQQCKIKEQYE